MSPPKKSSDSQAFFKIIDACGQLFIFRLGTFLDIWVCLAKQNGGSTTSLCSLYQTI